MPRTIFLAALAVSATLELGIGTDTALAAPDPATRVPVALSAGTTALPDSDVRLELADAEARRPKQSPMSTRDAVLYNIITDQISEMRRKSALPAVMCIAQSTGDGGAETISRTLMARLEADNAQVQDSLFTLKQATECQAAGKRLVDRVTHERAMLILAGPMESEMKGLMTGCGDYVGGFVRATDDSDFDFYTVNGGDVARKLGCELAQ